MSFSYFSQEFLFSNFRIFIFAPNLTKTNSRELISNMTIYFFTQIRYFWSKYPNKPFFVPNLGIFVFSRNFVVRQIWGCWFQTWQKFFKTLAQKYLRKAFLVSNLAIFIISQNFAIRQIRRCCFKIWQMFLNSSPKIPK